MTGITDAVDATKSMAYACDSNGRLARRHGERGVAPHRLCA
ncbi:MAG: hypothetical protein IPN84_16330 [Sphingomonadales bacterium]|nr:hypothetical protein [Sphingomonadales bacterium]